MSPRRLVILPHSPITAINRCNCGSAIVTRNWWRPSGTTTLKRSLVATPTIPNFVDRPRLPSWSHTDADAPNNDEMNQRGKDESLIDTFPEHFCPGVEMDVCVVKVTSKYALCRPVDYPKLKGIIYNHELTESMEVDLERELDATNLVELNMIYKAVIMDLKPPNRIVFSLRRVRRVWRDDFRPVTIAIFNLHPCMGEWELRTLMKESGEVLQVSMFTDQEDANQPSYVTFAHEADAMSAVKKWNKRSMPCNVDEQTLYRRVRCKKARHQVFRDQVQMYLDKQLEEKIEHWNETPSQRRFQEEMIASMAIDSPWLGFDRSKEQKAYFADTFPEYTVKNNPRKA